MSYTMKVERGLVSHICVYLSTHDDHIRKRSGGKICKTLKADTCLKTTFLRENNQDRECTYIRNTGQRSRNNCYRGKAVRIKYSVCFQP
jgi:hypothetical protein